MWVLLPGAYVSLMFMQLMLHKFATAGTRDRVERGRERENGTGGESVALLPFVFFRCHGRHFVRFTLTSAALVPFVYCQFSLLHFWSPSKICHSPPRNVVVRSYIDGILYFPNGGGAGKERQGGGGRFEHCCLMKIFLRQVFRKDLQHLQKAPATTIKATATTATNDATEVLRISVK